MVAMEINYYNSKLQFDVGTNLILLVRITKILTKRLRSLRTILL